MAAPGRRKISPIDRIQRKKEELKASRAMLVSLQSQSGVPITNEREIEIIKNSINSQFESGEFTGRPKNTEIENLRTQIHQILFKKMVFVTNKYPAIKGSKDGKKIVRYNTKLDRFNDQIEEVAESIINLTGGQYDENVLMSNALWSSDEAAEERTSPETSPEADYVPVELVKAPEVSKIAKGKSSILRALEETESIGIAASAHEKGYRSKIQKENDEQLALSTIIGSKKKVFVEQTKPAHVEEIKPVVLVGKTDTVQVELLEKKVSVPSQNDNILDMIMKMEIREVRMALLEAINEIEDQERNYRSLKGSHNSLQKHLNELQDSTEQTSSERRMRKMRMLSM